MPAGCPFHPRCDAVRDVCRTDVPPQATPAPGRMSLCHFASDIMAGREPTPAADVTASAPGGPVPEPKGDPDD